MRKQTILQELAEIEKIIYSQPYGELPLYLKGIRDVINLINGEETGLSDYVKLCMERME